MALANIQTFSGSSTTGAGATGGKKTLNQLGSDDFMTLMLAQLKSQDPLKPTDNTAFIAQMAQLTSVSGINDMKTALTEMSTSLRGTQLLNASTLIGQSVVVAGAPLTLTAGEAVSGQMTLPVGAQQVSVQVFDSGGQVVRTQALGPQSAGVAGFQWDGRDTAGNPVPAGTYTFSARYGNGAGSTELTPELRRPVQRVNLPSGGASAELDVRGIGTVKLSDVKSIG